MSNLSSIESSFNYFRNWDNRLSPKFFFEKKFKTFCQSISDNRLYDSKKLIKFLTDSGAELIEYDKIISDEIKKIDDNLLPFYDPENYYLYILDKHLITIEGKDTVSINIYWPINQISTLHDQLRSFVLQRQRTCVSVLINSPSQGVIAKSIDFKSPKIDNLELNYGSGFNNIYNKIINKLNDDKSGLFLFHGCPGTGKTSFIKYLTGIIDKEFIFIPVGMANELATPAFVTLLMDHPNAILVLEDAEQALQARENNIYNSSTVSTLLNLTDGLLGSILNVKIIATFNLDKQLIDKALLRKGRLGFDYTFDKLSIDDAKRLAIHLKKSIKITEPTTLTDIYNAEDDTNYSEPSKRSMGFFQPTPTKN